MNEQQRVAITYAISPCSLGALALAATPTGICLATLADTPDTLHTQVRQHYPGAQPASANDEQMQHSIDAFLAYLNGESQIINVILDVDGTSFQWRVWAELRTIPYGCTRSYREVAQAIGAPTAVRAVANACGANRVALAIPCHRVVRSDGTLGGYGAGIERKRALLELEQQQRHRAVSW